MMSDQRMHRAASEEKSTDPGLLCTAPDAPESDFLNFTSGITEDLRRLCGRCRNRKSK